MQRIAPAVHWERKGLIYVLNYLIDKDYLSIWQKEILGNSVPLSFGVVFECSQAEQGWTVYADRKRAVLGSPLEVRSQTGLRIMAKTCLHSTGHLHGPKPWSSHSLWPLLVQNALKTSPSSSCQNPLPVWLEAVSVIYNPQAGLEYELNCLSH